MAEFLNENFYSKIYPDIERVTDREKQLAGIDLVLPDGTKVDEKCMFYPIGQKSTGVKPYNTFAFECSFKTRDKGRVTGWFLDPEKETEAYMLCWIHDCKTAKNPTKEDFLEVEVALIDRDELYYELFVHRLSKEKIKLDSDRILEIADWDEEELTEDEIHGRFKSIGFCSKYHYKKYGQDRTNAYYVHSKQLAEEPINLILSKDVLMSLPSTKHWIVTPGATTELKKVKAA